MYRRATCGYGYNKLRVFSRRLKSGKGEEEVPIKPVSRGDRNIECNGGHLYVHKDEHQKLNV